MYAYGLTQMTKAMVKAGRGRIETYAELGRSRIEGEESEVEGEGGGRTKLQCRKES